MHLLLIGTPYPLVLRNSRVNDRTFRLWVARFNEQGIDGLVYRPIPGRPRKITPGQVAYEILPVVDDPSMANQTYWTATKHWALRINGPVAECQGNRDSSGG